MSPEDGAEELLKSKDLKIQEITHTQEMLVQRVNLRSILHRILSNDQVGNTNTIQPILKAQVL